MLDVRLQRKSRLLQIQNLGHVTAQGTTRRSQPDRMDVGLDQFLVTQFESSRSDCSGNHQVGLAEKILVMLASFTTEAHHECRLPTTARTTASLCVVCWRGWD